MPLSKLDFVRKNVNKSLYIRATRLDRTIKAIINSYTLPSNKKDSKIKLIALEYLNTLRIIYFLNRLKFFNKVEFRKLNRTYRKNIL